MKKILEQYGLAIVTVIAVILLISFSTPVSSLIKRKLSDISLLFNDKAETINERKEKENKAKKEKFIGQGKSFYIYHSSDCSIEKVYFNDPRIINGTFNLVYETNAGNHYGGYYSS